MVPNAIANYRFVVKLKGTNVDVERRYRTTDAWMNRHGRLWTQRA
jgi:hypothetical protein